ncbi:adenylate isopentenyltransferase-like [Magnolia sinica]|uniref:adenylate isopentenyltransferase-like n=1 Tax=Magnolia sinica TaxID=86752 RepID=UPI00265A9981|nr:adenylate isopentenyltransferase-like [Magnolia sinica]
MGATGSGKSRLSIDIATTVGSPTSEIINADKIQLYKGLDITTNKISMQERRQVPHHLLGDFDPSDGEISAIDYRSIAASKATDILSRGGLPILAGGSNTYIHALVADRYKINNGNIGCIGSHPMQLRYDCCFIWVDVSPPALVEYLLKRVDSMLEVGMFEELAGFFRSSGSAGSCLPGLGKAIGVPEFERYFRRYGGARPEGDSGRGAAFEDAVEEIKENTLLLAEKQVGKIQRLRSQGWDLQRMDATEAVRAALRSDGVRFQEAWEEEVVGPSLEVVGRFLEDRF